MRRAAPGGMEGGDPRGDEGTPGGMEGTPGAGHPTAPGGTQGRPRADPTALGGCGELEE